MSAQPKPSSDPRDLLARVSSTPEGQRALAEILRQAQDLSSIPVEETRSKYRGVALGCVIGALVASAAACCCGSGGVLYLERDNIRSEIHETARPSSSNAK